jgi:hypothetical protein
MSATFAGFTYNNVVQCSGSVNFITGGQTFDRRASGAIDGGTISLTSTWVDVFTVTLWSLQSSFPQAGYAVINSGSGGLPAPFGTYSVSDVNADESAVSSLTYVTPLALGAGGSLPVLFTNYDVKCNDKGALLVWGTATEQNSDRFEIQRSSNGIDWSTIDNVKAAGNSDVQRNYQYLDLNGGVSFYRIRQVDIDGQFVYTAIKQTNCKAGMFDVTLYPVPARDHLTVVIKSDKAVRTDLQILDMNGRIVRRNTTEIRTGNNNIRMDVSVLAAGEYILVSSDPSILINKKFTVVR